VVGRRELKNQQSMHRQRLQNIKSAIDTRPPASQPHLTLYGRDYVAKKRATTEAAFADLKMIQSIAKTMTREHKIDERKGPTSLNGDGRKKEVMRVMQDNHRLLDAIENCSPMMRTTDLLRSEKMRKRYIINSSHTMRLSGEYDDDIYEIHAQDKAKLDEYKRQAENTLTKQRMLRSSGSFSLPSLSPNGQRGAEQSPAKPSSPPKKTKRAQPSSKGGGKGAGYSQEPAQSEMPASPPKAAPRDEPQDEDPDTQKSSPGRPPVRFELEESEQAGPADFAKTPYPGKVDMQDFAEAEQSPQEEGPAETDVSAALAKHAADSSQQSDAAAALSQHAAGSSQQPDVSAALAQHASSSSKQQDVAGALSQHASDSGQQSDAAAAQFQHAAGSSQQSGVAEALLQHADSSSQLDASQGGQASRPLSKENESVNYDDDEFDDTEDQPEEQTFESED
jgi:hypothetical protein